MSHHHHDHGDGCGHEHNDDDHIKPGEGQQDSLYSRIDRDNVTGLNEQIPEMTKRIIKPFDKQTDENEYVESDADDQLIIRIPFIGSVKLRAIIMKAGPNEQTPEELHVFANRDELDFDQASSGAPEPTQKLSSIAVGREVISYPLKTAKFNNVRSIHIFVPKSLGGDTTRIYFLGFKGEWLGEHRREGPTNIIYESAPQVKDHAKIPGTESGAHSLGPGRGQ
jgi:PITH domain